LLSFAANL